MKTQHWLLVILITVVTSIATTWLITGKTVSDVYTQTAYERVRVSGTLRCGYHSFSPYIIKDANTGKMAGLYVDYIEKLAEWLNLKVIWQEEIGLGEMVTALETKRIDAFCGLLWPNATRAQRIDFTQPFSYMPLNAYVRASDKRFDQNSDTINRSEITISAVDGTYAARIAKLVFQRAKLAALPEMTNPSQMFLEVTTGKADIVFSDPFAAERFTDNNPNQLRLVPLPAPIRLLPNVIGLPRGEYELVRMLDTAAQEMREAGMLDRILKPYETQQKFWRIAKPYETNNQ